MNSTQKYSEIEKSSLNQVELEVRALVRSASSLNHIKENWEEEKSNLDEALGKNRRLWTIFASGMAAEDCPQPLEIRAGILNLANFIFKRTVDVLVNPTPEKLTTLIDINMNIARGLSEKKAVTENSAPAKSALSSGVEAKNEKTIEEAPKEKDEYGDIFGD